MVEYFHDFRELHRKHEKFCHENFLTAAPLSTGLDTVKSINHEDHESLRPWKFGAVQYILP